MRRLLGRRNDVKALFDRVKAIPPTFNRIRIHGYLSLDQLLRTTNDFAFPDFGGDPSQSVAQRRAKQCALKDLAAMIRSFSYLAKTNPAHVGSTEWEPAVTEQFLASYRQEAANASFLPSDPAAFDALLQAFLLDKAFDELDYELANRPDFVRIPLQCILDLLGETSPTNAISSVDAPAEQQAVHGNPDVEIVRATNSKSALIFIDTGTLDKDGWQPFPRVLATAEPLSSLNVLILKVVPPPPTTSPNPFTGFSAQRLPALVAWFNSQLNHLGLLEYQDIAFLAHGDGGLLLQRILLDNIELSHRTSRVFLFGTPSAGIKSTFLKRILLNKPPDDQTPDSPFIKQLRRDWNERFTPNPPFQLYAIAGDKDGEVPPESSLEPFDRASRRIVPGDHVSMVRPKDANDAVVQLLIDALKSPVQTQPPPPPKENLSAGQWFDRAYKSNDPGEQIAAYNEAIRLNPKDYYSFYNRAIARTAKGDLHAALEDYNAAIQLKSNDADAFMNRAMVRADLAELDGALQDYDAALRLHPRDADIFINRGIARAEKGDLDGALQDYDAALRIRPNDADALYNRANARGDKGDQAGALADYTASIQLTQENPDAFRYRSEIFRDQGNLDRASEDLSEALRLRAYDVDIASDLPKIADLYRDRENFAKAESLYSQSLAINERAFGRDDFRLLSSLNGLGLTYKSQGKFQEADSSLRRALEIGELALGPDHPTVGMTLNNLGLLRYSEGKYEDAKMFYQRALAIFERASVPDDRGLATVLSNIGSLLSRELRYEEAEPYFQRALESNEKALGPNHPSIATNLNDLADLYKNLGKFSEAGPLYRRILEIYEGPKRPEKGTDAITARLPH